MIASRPGTIHADQFAGAKPQTAGRQWCSVRNPLVGFALAVGFAVACTRPAPPPAPRISVPSLPPAPTADSNALGAEYLAQLEPRFAAPWQQFLLDCRARLPASHPLNQLQLAVVVQLEISPTGQVRARTIQSSGNPDFDAVAAAIVAEHPQVPPPPPLVQSDDSRTYIDWTFARDRRRATAASAHVIRQEAPLPIVVQAWLTQGAWQRAAQRLARAWPAAGVAPNVAEAAVSPRTTQVHVPHRPERDAATTTFFAAALATSDALRLPVDVLAHAAAEPLLSARLAMEFQYHLERAAAGAPSHAAWYDYAAQAKSEWRVHVQEQVRAKPGLAPLIMAYWFDDADPSWEAVARSLAAQGEALAAAIISSAQGRTSSTSLHATWKQLRAKRGTTELYCQWLALAPANAQRSTERMRELRACLRAPQARLRHLTLLALHHACRATAEIAHAGGTRAMTAADSHSPTAGQLAPRRQRPSCVLLAHEGTQPSRPAALADVVRGLRDPDRQVRDATIALLAEVSPAPPAQLMAQLDRAPDLAVARRIAQYPHWLAAQPSLARTLAQTPDPEVACAAARSAACLQHVTPAMQAILRDAAAPAQSAETQCAAAAQLLVAPTLPNLRLACASRLPEIAATARRALGALYGRDALVPMLLADVQRPVTTADLARIAVLYWRAPAQPPAAQLTLTQCLRVLRDDE